MYGTDPYYYTLRDFSKIFLLGCLSCTHTPLPKFDSIFNKSNTYFAYEMFIYSCFFTIS